MSEIVNSKPYDQRLAGLIIAPFKNSALHPNHITTLTLLLGLTSACMFAFYMKSLGWLAALLYMLSVLTDHMDGELARITGKFSTFGHHYDFIVGGINYTALFIGIGIGLRDLGLWALMLGFIAGLSNPFILYLRMNMEKTFGQASVEHPRFGGFENEDFIYLIGPITWSAGIVWFFIPFALGNVGYLIWTLKKYSDWKQTSRTKSVAEKP